MTIQSNISTGGAGSQVLTKKYGCRVAIPIKIPIDKPDNFIFKERSPIFGSVGGNSKNTVSRPKVAWYNPRPNIWYYKRRGFLNGWAITPRN